MSPIPCKKNNELFQGIDIEAWEKRGFIKQWTPKNSICFMFSCEKNSNSLTAIDFSSMELMIFLWKTWIFDALDDHLRQRPLCFLRELSSQPWWCNAAVPWVQAPKKWGERHLKSPEVRPFFRWNSGMLGNSKVNIDCFPSWFFVSSCFFYLFVVFCTPRHGFDGFVAIHMICHVDTLGFFCGNRGAILKCQPRIFRKSLFNRSLVSTAGLKMDFPWFSYNMIYPLFNRSLVIKHGNFHGNHFSSWNHEFWVAPVIHHRRETKLGSSRSICPGWKLPRHRRFPIRTTIQISMGISGS